MLTEQDLATIWDNAPRSGHVTQREHIARAIIAAYTNKLRQGVELPEPVALGYEAVGLPEPQPVFGFAKDQLQQYGDARDQAGYLRGLDDAKRVCSISWDGDSDTYAYTAACNDCAAAIEKLKGGE